MVTFYQVIQTLFGFPTPPIYDPIQFVVSPYRFISPLTLFVVRVILGSYVLAVRIWSEVYQGIGNNIYFTNWSYWHLLSYYIFVIIISIKMKSWRIKYDYIDFSVPSKFASVKDNNFTRFCKYLSVSSEVLTATTMGVVIVFWGILYDPATPFHGQALALNISEHALNAVFMLSDLFMCCRKIYPAHIFYVLFWLLIYMFTAMIYHAVTGIWVYNILDTSSPLAAAYYIGLMVLFILLYYLGFILQKFRDYASFKINGERGPIIEM